MYTIDGRDRVVELQGFPGGMGGAPSPLVVANDDQVLLGYGSTAGKGEWSLVEFELPSAHYLGMPDDEALPGHPLYRRGLERHRVCEVVDSSWIRALERLNRAHPDHLPGMLSGDRHFIFAFKDCLFECIAHDVRLVGQFARRSALVAAVLRRAELDPR